MKHVEDLFNCRNVNITWKNQKHNVAHISKYEDMGSDIYPNVVSLFLLLYGAVNEALPEILGIRVNRIPSYLSDNSLSCKPLNQVSKNDSDLPTDYQIGMKQDTLEMVPFCSFGKDSGDCKAMFHDVLTWRGLSSAFNSPPLIK